MKRIFSLLVAVLMLPSAALAQVAISSLPSATTLSGTEVVPVVQTGSTRQVSVGAIGRTLLGGANSWSLKQAFAASTTSAAGINIAPGTAPTSPINGDCWITAAGLYCQVAGATQGPFGTGTGGGSVTGVGLAAPSIFTVSNSPVTTSGNLTLALNSQSANLHLASPCSGSGVPTFRAICAGDIPTLNQNTTGTATNVTGIVAAANGGTGVATAGPSTVLAGPTIGTGALSVRALVANDLPTAVAYTNTANSFGPAQNFTNYLSLGNTDLLIYNNAQGLAVRTGISSDYHYWNQSAAGRMTYDSNEIYSRRDASCANIKMYGGVNDGSTDNLAAFNSAVAASSNGSGLVCVYIPAGVWYFSGSPVITQTTATPSGAAIIRGDGDGVTILKMAAGASGPTFNINTINQRAAAENFSVIATAGETSAVCVGFVLNTDVSGGVTPGESHVNNVSCHGDDGFHLNHGFAKGFYDFGVSNVDIVNFNAYGWGCNPGPFCTNNGRRGIEISGSVNRIPVAINIRGGQSIYWGYSLMYGNYTQGLQITNWNSVGNWDGIVIADSQTGNDELAILASHFNNSSYNIYIGSQLTGFTIGTSYLYTNVNGQASIYNGAGGDMIVMGNEFVDLASGSQRASGQVVVGGSLTFPKMITGNTFRNGQTCVVIQSPAVNTNVQSNNYNQCTTNVSNGGNTSNTVGGGSSALEPRDIPRVPANDNAMAEALAA